MNKTKQCKQFCIKGNRCPAKWIIQQTDNDKKQPTKTMNSRSAILIAVSVLLISGGIAAVQAQSVPGINFLINGKYSFYQNILLTQRHFVLRFQLCRPLSKWHSTCWPELSKLGAFWRATCSK